MLKNICKYLAKFVIIKYMDLAIIESLQNVRTPFFDFVFNVLKHMGDIAFFIVVFAIFFWIYDKKFAVNFALNYGIISILNNFVLKNIVKRTRPLYNSTKYPPYRGYPTCYSFPSGHSAAISSVSTYTLYELKKNKKSIFNVILPIAIFLCLVVGFSRMYLGVHYLTDVLVGLALGFVVSFILFKYLKITNEKIYKWFLIVVPIYVVLLILMDSDTISMYGSFAASIIVGIVIESKYIKYNINKYKNIWIKLIIGGAILIALGVVFYFVPNNKYFQACEYICYGLSITVLVPYIFTKLKGKDDMITNSEKETEKLAKAIAKKLKGGEVILLNGDLGCGKSVFARGFIKSFGVKEPVTSPTFTIVNKYIADKCNIYHFDLYRLEDEEEAFAAGLDELIDEEGAIKLIEWSERAEGMLPSEVITINITKLTDTSRKFEIKGIEI